jgi:hypothetical protein
VVNHREAAPLTRTPNSTPLRAIAVTMLDSGTPRAASVIALQAAIEILRKKCSLPAMKATASATSERLAFDLSSAGASFLRPGPPAAPR